VLLIVLLGASFFQASASCNGGALLSGWYGVRAGGAAQTGSGLKTLSAALFFDGNCNLSGSNVSGGLNENYGTTTATGTYNQNPDGTYTIVLNLAGDPVQQTYVVGVSESGAKARGIETDGTAMATISIQSQITTLTAGYTNASLTGTYAAYCWGPGYGVDLNYVTFDGNGNLSGQDPYDNEGNNGDLPYTGHYTVNSDGTFSGTLDGIFSVFPFNGVIDAGVTEVQYIYNRTGFGNVVTCSGRQFTATNLSGWYGFVVGGEAANNGVGKYLSGALQFDGSGGLTASNVSGGINGNFATTTATGSYVLNSDNTVNVVMNLAGQSQGQTYVVGISQSGNEAVGIETDGTAMATIDIQSQTRSQNQTYDASSLNGAYAVSCFGSMVNLNWIAFDGNGNLAGINAYDSTSAHGSSTFSGTYSVNSDGTFSGALAGALSQYTFTGVLENGTSQIGYTYYQAGTGGVSACIGESTFGPSGPAQVAASPSLSPAPGAYGSSQSVTLSSSTPNAVIYYTTNGSIPNKGSLMYSNPVPVSATTTIQAITVAPGYSNSAITAGTYFLTAGLPAASTPTFSPTPGTYSSAQSVTLLDSTPGAVIYYTTNGSTPTTSSSVYSSAIPVSATTTIQAMAVASGFGNSDVVSGTYTINLPNVATPTFSPTPGTYTSVQTVTLSDTTPGAVIHCTTDGSTPTQNSAVCTTLTVGTTATINAIATASGYNNSALASGTYTIILPAAMPSFSPAPGSYSTPQTVTLSDTTPGAVIHCTTDGSTPTQSSAVCSSVSVGATTTIQAFATAAGYSDSSTASGSYTIAQTQTISFPAIPAQTYGVSPLTLSATASSGLAVAYSVLSGPASVSGSQLTLTGTGSVTVQASQPGNNQYAAASPVSQTFAVNQANTTLALASSFNPAGLGQSVTLTATVAPQLSGQTTGTVTFKDGNTTLAAVAVSANAGSFTTSALSTGTHTITAVYSGDGNFKSSSSSSLAQVVSPAATATSLATSLSPSPVGKSVTFTTTVTSAAGTPTGTVKFYDGSTLVATLPLHAGSAHYATAGLTPGSHVISVVFLGSSNFAGSSSVSVTEIIMASTSTTLASSANPGMYAQTIAFKATVSSTLGAPPDGETVTFIQGTITLGTGVLSGGQATFTTSSLGVGTKPVKAVYGGDANFVKSTSSALSQVINKASTTSTLISSQNPAPVGQNVTFTATIIPKFGGTPTGVVVFKDGATTLKTVTLSGGSASYSSSKLAKGSHSLTITYNGDTNFTGTTASLTQTVN
jgi:hypothetical protein